MSIIGLLDWDLTKWRTPTVFNLELMKIAAYHKNKLHDIVQMERKFSSIECSKVYVQKDYEDYIYPKELTSDPKVIYGGLALSDGKYVPLPDDIEKCKADTSIYTNMFRYYSGVYEDARVYRSMMEGAHIRLSLDGKTISPFFEVNLPKGGRKVRNVIFHDKDLFQINDAYDVLTDLDRFYGATNLRIGFKFPPIITNKDDFIRWAQFKKTININNIYVTEIMDTADLQKLFSNSQKITYYFRAQEWEKDKMIEALTTVFLQALFLSENNVTILLKIESSLDMNGFWRTFADIFNCYMLSRKVYRNRLIVSCHTFTKMCYHKISRERKIELFKFIKQANPILFDYLYTGEYTVMEKNKLEAYTYTFKQMERGGGTIHGYFNPRNDPGEDKPEQLDYSEFIQPFEVYVE